MAHAAGVQKGGKLAVHQVINAISDAAARGARVVSLPGRNSMACSMCISDCLSLASILPAWSQFCGSFVIGYDLDAHVVQIHDFMDVGGASPPCSLLHVLLHTVHLRELNFNSVQIDEYVRLISGTL